MLEHVRAAHETRGAVAERKRLRVSLHRILGLAVVQAELGHAVVERNAVRAGGPERFGGVPRSASDIYGERTARILIPLDVTHDVGGEVVVEAIGVCAFLAEELHEMERARQAVGGARRELVVHARLSGCGAHRLASCGDANAGRAP
jgi:hypothetical protein